mmetsp:Transcript_119102/g.210580  ORF Transcript_119102/g.210580 Transcript_119102/m.210580 type:complete len:262 (-) Transcript_119102:57-842(-)
MHCWQDFTHVFVPLLLMRRVPATLAAVDGSHQQVVMRSELPFGTSELHASAAPELRVPGSIAASSLETHARAIDGDIEVTPDELEQLSPPAYPCTWYLDISRVDKGHSQQWRTMTVRGARGDSFDFAGCTTAGFEPQAAMCKSGAARGSVRLLRNQRKEVVGFGGCCMREVSNFVADARLGECEEKPVVSTSSIAPDQAAFEDPVVNMSELPTNASFGKEVAVGLASGGTLHAALKISLLVGLVTMGIVSVLIYSKYFSAK